MPTTAIDNTVFDTDSKLHQLVYANLPLTVLTVLVNSVILCIVQWDYVAHATVLAWLAITNLVSLIRIFLYQRFKQLDVNQPIPDIWKKITLATSAVTGLTWGATSIFLFPENSIAHQVFLAFVIAGMCAGAVTTLSPVMSSIIAFITLAMLPLITHLLLIEGSVNYAMATMATLFAVMMLITAKRLNRTMTESLEIRQENKVSQGIIKHQAYHDELTNLPNRRLLTEKIKDEISRCLRHHHFSAILFLDLDHFKTINDSLGHTIGDELIQSVATRLKSRMRNEDTVARLGGDEFIILISEAGNSPAEAAKNSQTITMGLLDLFAQPFDIESGPLEITASIGVAIFPLNETTPEELLQKSDVAMYEAKEAGRNKIRLFKPEMQAVIDNQLNVENGLRQALKEQQLELYYQPLFDSEKNLFAVESLIRWNHPEKGIIAPDNFIGIAEKSALIIAIGDWVLQKSCETLTGLSAAANINMCVNVSPRQFEESSFVNKLKHILQTTGADPTKIRLEITEDMVLNNVELMIEKMLTLSAMGIHFSIDDFGTGYSSLAYLKRLPVDLLKIDKSFVLDINTDKNDAAIVKTIIALAQHMNIGLVAEGVENQEIFETLAQFGCHKFQGYLFGKPMPLSALYVEFKILDPDNKLTEITPIKTNSSETDFSEEQIRRF